MINVDDFTRDLKVTLSEDEHFLRGLAGVLKKHPARRYRDLLPLFKCVKHLNNGEKWYMDVPFTQPRMQKQKSHFLLFELEKSQDEAEHDKGPVGEAVAGEGPVGEPEKDNSPVDYCPGERPSHG